MYAYVGTETAPPCAKKHCWYFSLPVQTITQATLDQLKQEGVEWNNRATGIWAPVGSPTYKYQYTGLLYKEPTDEL